MRLFLTRSFLTKSLSLLKSTGIGSNLSTSNLSTLRFKLFKLVGIFFNSSTFLANSDMSNLMHFLNLFLFHK